MPMLMIDISNVSNRIRTILDIFHHFQERRQFIAKDATERSSGQRAMALVKVPEL